MPLEDRRTSIVCITYCAGLHDQVQSIPKSATRLDGRALSGILKVDRLRRNRGFSAGLRLGLGQYRRSTGRPYLNRTSPSRSAHRIRPSPMGSSLVVVHELSMLSQDSLSEGGRLARKSDTNSDRDSDLHWQ